MYVCFFACVRAFLSPRFQKYRRHIRTFRRRKLTLREKKMENRSEVNLRYTLEVSLHCTAKSDLFLVVLKNARIYTEICVSIEKMVPKGTKQI